MKGQTTLVLKTLASRLGRWTRVELLQATELSKKDLTDSLHHLHRKGLMVRLVGGDFKVTKRGLHVLIEEGELKPGPSAPYELERSKDAFPARLWRAFRLKRRATAQDLVSLAALPGERHVLRTAHRYLAAYAAAGIAICQPKAAPGPGSSNGRHVYVLIKDPGPKPLQLHLQKRRLFDPNTGVTHDLP